MLYKMVENFKSGIDNIRQDSPEWVTQKISTELASLSTEVETDGQKKDMFYKINGNEVEYHMEIVKKYLDSIKNLERNALKDKGAAWIMSVQIALESKWYDVQKIDGCFWNNTREAVRSFQKASSFPEAECDGLPWKNTITALCNVLDWKSVLEGISFSSQSGWWGESADKTQSIEWGNASNWYKIEKVWSKQCKVKSIASIDELPKDYKRDDPKDYDESSEETYPTVYRMKKWNIWYVFYSNGRCKTPEGMKNTKAVVESLKWSQSSSEETIPQDNKAEYSWELPGGMANELVKYVNDNLKDELTINSGERLVINWWINVNHANLSLLTWLSNIEYQSVEYPINLKKCFNDDWSIADDYIKNVLIPIAKKDLKEKKKAVLAVKWWLLKWKKYKMEELFWQDEEVKKNRVLKVKLEKYFKLFDNQEITFDLWNYADDTKFDKWDIKLTFDDDNGNEDYNKWKNNPDILIFPAKDIIDDNYKLNETRFKQKLQWIIKAIVKKEF